MVLPGLQVGEDGADTALASPVGWPHRELLGTSAMGRDGKCSPFTALGSWIHPAIMAASSMDAAPIFCHLASL